MLGIAKVLAMGRVLRLLLALSLSGAGCSAAEPEEQMNPAEVRLDLRPFFPRKDFSHALYVRLDTNGHATVINYSPFGLVVMAVHEGMADRKAAAGILRQARDGVRKPERAARQAGQREGDSFTLSFKSDMARTVECGGLLQEYSGAVREAVEKLVALRTSVAASAPAAAYLQSMALGKDLAAQLRLGGKARFVALQDFPANLRPAITRLTEHSVGFAALTAAEQQALAQLGAQCFFGTEVGTYQLTVFSPPPAKGREDTKP